MHWAGRFTCSGHRPSVDTLFRSVAKVAGGGSVGVLLTGMGVDGARGLLAMKEAGMSTLAQDKVTSVVYGMPREAVELGAVSRVCSIGTIAGKALACFRAPQRVARSVTVRRRRAQS